MSNNKTSWKIIVLGIISMVTIINLVFTIYMATHERFSFPDGESYISILVTLLGFCITFIIGYQIYNAVSIQKEIKEYRALIDNKVDELIKDRDRIEQLARESLYYNAYTIGRSNHLDGKYLNAFRAYNTGILYALNIRDYNKIPYLCSFMRECLDRFSSQAIIVDSEERKEQLLYEIEERKDEILKHPCFRSSNYRVEYLRCINEFHPESIDFLFKQ
ncbi:hypothetical protein [Phocaeicola sartorii]|uniref:hypothetical protein n=1 Tax=Phocaeicola sartorii TaxID=671267 RepID=UPI003512AC8B